MIIKHTSIQCPVTLISGPVIFIVGEGEGGEGLRIVGGITSFWGEKKGGSVVAENPKGGIAENFGGIQRGNH